MEKVLRVALVWRGTVMQEVNLRGSGQATLGKTPTDTFNVPTGGSDDKHVLVAGSGGTFTLTTTDGMRGRISVRGEAKDFEGRNQFSISDGDWGVIHVGEVAFYFQFIERTAIAAVSPLNGIEYALMSCLTGSFFVHAILLALALGIPPDLDRENHFEMDERLVSIIVDEPPDAIEEVEEEDMPDDESTSAAAGGEEGRFGEEDAEVEDSILPDHDGPLTDEIPTTELGMAMNSAIGQSGALTNVFGNTSNFSNTFGADFATAGTGDALVVGRGVGGMGMRGTGRGGGGDGLGRVHGVGSIDTGAGQGQGASLGNRGERERRAQVSQGRPNVNGFLSREQIERVVRRHQRGIRYCYERELQNDPELGGRITVNWTVGLDGRVQQASIAENSMGNRNVESCILSEVRRMRFDQPDGGMVAVAFPFSFRSE